MVDLDELKRLAEGATPGPWKAYDAAVRACDEIHSLIAFGYMRNIGPAERDAAFIAAMHPDTAKKLIAVALAAEAAFVWLPSPDPSQTNAPARALAALRKALEELN